ncbi:MAG: hypothetical protein ABL996_09490 [Micropepsaceae bacterium]
MNETVLFHTHGLGPFDFSSLIGAQLNALDDLAASRSAYLCPTIYLMPEKVAPTRTLLAEFAAVRAAGGLQRTLGFSIEGPVLGARGGIPTGSVWNPTAEKWREIASWFHLGLKYIVVSPDLLGLDEELERGFTFSDLLTLIYDAGGRVALGHFAGISPTESAIRVVRLLDYLESRYEPSPYLILTDHLFNDMPRNFRHAFRSPAELAARDAELAKVLNRAWVATDLSNLLGPVPSTLLAAAKAGRLTPSLNFDGGHVDLAICKRVIEYLTPSRIIAITDHTEIDVLAGESLTKHADIDLYFRGDGVLAASSANHERQRQNMIRIGLDETAIADMFYRTPLAALNFAPRRRANDKKQ